MLFNAAFVYDNAWPSVTYNYTLGTGAYTLPTLAADFWRNPFRFVAETYNQSGVYQGTRKFSGNFSIYGMESSRPGCGKPSIHPSIVAQACRS